MAPTGRFPLVMVISPYDHGSMHARVRENLAEAACRPPAGRRLAMAGRHAVVGAGRMATIVLATLTRPLPADIAEYRGPARTALVLGALLIVGSTLGVTEQPAMPAPLLWTLGGLGAMLGAASMMSRLHSFLDRCDGLVGVALVTALVTVSGGTESIYRPLIVLLLLYGALFYDTGRVVATGALLLVAMLIPPAWNGLEPSAVAVLLVQIPVGALTVAVAHVLVQRTRATARTDGLTGLQNHAAFQSVLRTEHARMRRYGSDYSVLLVDIDHFKSINDTQGHQVGDEVLRGLGHLLRERRRDTDTVARYGGEEFAVLLPETARADAIALADQLRIRVRAAELPVSVTVSIGIADTSDGLDATAAGVLARADEALYMAKRKGRDRVAASVPATAAFSYLSDLG